MGTNRLASKQARGIHLHGIGRSPSSPCWCSAVTQASRQASRQTSRQTSRGRRAGKKKAWVCLSVCLAGRSLATVEGWKVPTQLKICSRAPHALRTASRCRALAI